MILDILTILAIIVLFTGVATLTVVATTMLFLKWWYRQ